MFRCPHRRVSDVPVNGPQLFSGLKGKGHVVWFPYVDEEQVLNFEPLCPLSVHDLRALYGDFKTILEHITH